MSGESGVLTLAVEDVVYRGSGLARHEGKVYFVSGVLPGEVAGVRVLKTHKKYCEAEAICLEKTSPDRIEPECPLVRRVGNVAGAPACAGCAYQHMKYETELALKQSQFISFLSRQAGVDPGVAQPPFGSPLATGYRNKIVLHAGADGIRPVLGYIAGDNKTTIDTACCKLAVSPVNELLARMRNVDGFLSGLPARARVTFRYTPKDGPLCWVGKADDGEPWLKESSALGNVMSPRDGFFQINSPVAAELVRHVEGIIRDCACGCFVDLFCGVGIFAIAAARCGVGRVFGMDSDRGAIKAARVNAEMLGTPGVAFYPADANDWQSKAGRDVNRDSLAVLADPPRTGLDKALLESLCRVRPASIIYVSCAADTLARDAVALVKAGYRVVSCRLLDMFPRTPYFESVTHFSA